MLPAAETEAEWGEFPISRQVGCLDGERMERRDPPSVEATIRLASASAAALMFSGLVVATAWRDATPFGAPPILAAAAYRTSGSRRVVGGKRPVVGMAAVGSVQLPWITGAVVTTQLGFIPGGAVSAAVHTYSFLRRGRSHTMPVGDSSVGAAKQEIT
jgi:TctA family transporter